MPGVAQVAIWGERIPQRHIQVDPKKLAEHDVTLRQVMDAGANAVESGLMQYTDGAGGLRGWEWLFALEALPGAT